MNITCDLYSEWIKAIRTEFAKAGFPHITIPDQDCAILWQSWQRRMVSAKKRTVIKSDSFTCPPEHATGLSALDRAFLSGAEICPWQSKLIDKVSYEDGLLNDYGVLHFHLGQGIDASGYITRTDSLLFGIIRDDKVYEIGIYNHGDWYELDILNVIDRNWPQLLDAVTIKALGVAHSPKTKEEIKVLRSANIVTIVSLDSGRIIAPLGGGVATDGTSNDAVHSADYWAKFLKNADKVIIDYLNDCIRRGTLPAKDYEVRLHATETEIAGLVENYKIVVWRKKA